MKIPHFFYKYVSVLYTKANVSKNDRCFDKTYKKALMSCIAWFIHAVQVFLDQIILFCFVTTVLSWSLRRPRLTVALF